MTYKCRKCKFHRQIRFPDHTNCAHYCGLSHNVSLQGLKAAVSYLLHRKKPSCPIVKEIIQQLQECHYAKNSE